MADDTPKPKRPDASLALATKLRAGTVGDGMHPRRNQSSTERDMEGLAAKFKREHEHAVGEELARQPAPAFVPRNEFDFEQRTPPAMDPSTYHALQTMRAEVLSQAQVILDMVKAQDDAREAREAAKRAEIDARAEKRRKYIVPTITAVGIAVAGIIAAMAHGCS